MPYTYGYPQPQVTVDIAVFAPKGICGADDARDARRLPLDDLPTQAFDHADIVGDSKSGYTGISAYRWEGIALRCGTSYVVVEMEHPVAGQPRYQNERSAVYAMGPMSRGRGR